MILQRGLSEKNMRLCELRSKEVINMCNWKKLGCVEDVILDLCCGRIEAIIIPGPGKFCNFLGTEKEYVISVECIRKIGPDIILVEIQEEKCLQNCKL